ncbi:MAG: TolC family protein [Spirochaetales bacterium]|nr:TolC family protein [Leptospiraceae bacterium]MCP5479907.1 TolC family protein [Spirochaetales bacterium]MCP5486658.1 TolC family protein [Spirochaetales bacterium]
MRGVWPIAFLGLACLIPGDLGARRIDLQLAEEMALEHDLELRAAKFETRIAAEALAGRLRDFFPSLSVNYRRNRAVARRDIDNGTHSVQLSLSQPVYDGGRTLYAYEVARLDVRMARERASELENNLRFGVRAAYFALLGQFQNLEIDRESLQNARDLWERTRLEYAQGAVTALDYHQVENELRRRELGVEQSTAALQDSLNDFGRMIGLEPDELPELYPLESYEFEQHPVELDSEQLFRLALENRPDIRQARLALMRSRREYLITKYDYLPTIALTGSYGKTGNDWPPTNTEYSFGVNFTFRIFGNTLTTDVTRLHSANETRSGYSQGGQLNVYDNGAWREPHMRNELELMRALETDTQLRRSVESEVRRSLRDYQRYATELEIGDRDLAIQERRFRIDQLRHRRGEIALSEFLERELELRRARTELVALRIEHILRANQLELQLGLPLDSLALMEIRRLNESGAPRRLWRSTDLPEADSPQNPEEIFTELDAPPQTDAEESSR